MLSVQAQRRARQSQIMTAQAMSSYNSLPALGAVLRLLPCLTGMCTRGGGTLVRKERDRKEESWSWGKGWGGEGGERG